MAIPQRQKEWGRGKKREKQFNGSTVIVQDGKFESAMRQFKRKIEQNGTIQEVRDRMEYVKPTTKRKMAKGRAKARWRKYIASQGMAPKLY